MLNNSRVDLWQAQVNSVVDELNREVPANIQINGYSSKTVTPAIALADSW